MTDTIEDRARELAVYMIETGATVRAAAQHFGISKSTVHTVTTISVVCFGSLISLLNTSVHSQ